MRVDEKKNNLSRELSFKATGWIGTSWSLIIHTILFVIAFLLPLFGFPIDQVLLIVTTIVSLEAIYLAIFIQMSVNRNNENLEKVSKDIDEIQEDVEEITTDVDEISKDIDEIQEDEEMEAHTKTTLEKIEQGIKQLSIEIEKLKAEGK